MYDVRKMQKQHNNTTQSLSNNICGVSVLRKLEDKKNKKCFEDERKSKQHSINDFDSTS
jgi:hypothetical protein